MGRLCLVIACLHLCACEGDESCADCRDEKCADLVARCDDDPGCACMAGCLGERGLPPVEACLTECGLDARPPGYAPLEACVATACPDSDECSTPSDFTPTHEMDDCELGPDAGAGTSVGSGALPDCGFDPNLPFDPGGEVLQLQSADASVCVRVERRNEGAGSLANTEWTLLDLTLGPTGEVAQVVGPLCWYSSHHNFNDWVHATTDTRHYDLSLALDDHGGNRSYTLHTFAQGETDPQACAPLAVGQCAIGEAIPLVPVNP